MIVGGSTPKPRPRPAVHKTLIGTPAIRNPNNLPRINHLNFSNRHKTRSFVALASSRLFFPVTRHSPPPAMPFLIGPPVIRIRPKRLRINDLTFSNRLKTAPLAASRTRPLPFRVPVLIENPTIRNQAYLIENKPHPKILIENFRPASPALRLLKIQTPTLGVQQSVLK